MRLRTATRSLFGRGGERRRRCAPAGIRSRSCRASPSALAVPAYAGIPATDRDPRLARDDRDRAPGVRTPADRRSPTLPWAVACAAGRHARLPDGGAPAAPLLDALVRHGLDAADAGGMPSCSAHDAGAPAHASSAPPATLAARRRPAGVSVAGRRRGRLRWSRSAQVAWFEAPAARRTARASSRVRAQQADELAARLEDIGAEVRRSFRRSRSRRRADPAALDPRRRRPPATTTGSSSWHSNGVRTFFERLAARRRDVRGCGRHRRHRPRDRAELGGACCCVPRAGARRVSRRGCSRRSLAAGRRPRTPRPPAACAAGARAILPDRAPSARGAAVDEVIATQAVAPADAGTSRGLRAALGRGIDASRFVQQLDRAELRRAGRTDAVAAIAASRTSAGRVHRSGDSRDGARVRAPVRLTSPQPYTAAALAARAGRHIFATRRGRSACERGACDEPLPRPIGPPARAGATRSAGCVRETQVAAEQLVQPLFVVPGTRRRSDRSRSMPGVSQLSVDRAAGGAARLADGRRPASSAVRDPRAQGRPCGVAAAADGIIPQALRAIRRATPGSLLHHRRLPLRVHRPRPLRRAARRRRRQRSDARRCSRAEAVARTRARRRPGRAVRT